MFFRKICPLIVNNTFNSAQATTVSKEQLIHTLEQIIFTEYHLDTLTSPMIAVVLFIRTNTLGSNRYGISPNTNAGFIIDSASGRIAGVGARNGKNFNVKCLQHFCKSCQVLFCWAEIKTKDYCKKGQTLQYAVCQLTVFVVYTVA